MQTTANFATSAGLLVTLMQKISTRNARIGIFLSGFGDKFIPQAKRRR
ncbi:hypothetical protein CAMRE0001_0090 [Campylobacter rectus RM3267]|uniref:Uncharacterized protein n=1 Tax=Campylobacter rectus RM3267 TaxID=553218 RepID=B9CXR9_CAMRE|nr:hypothetical protein CAMRE0001_0090 [Campylobacter rectus RM3267]